MEEDKMKLSKSINKNKPMDDILSIIKQFVGYFEEVDDLQTFSEMKPNKNKNIHTGNK